MKNLHRDAEISRTLEKFAGMQKFLVHLNKCGVQNVNTMCIVYSYQLKLTAARLKNGTAQGLANSARIFFNLSWNSYTLPLMYAYCYLLM